MSTTKHERPGVYSSYEASSVVTYTAGRKQVGLVGVSEVATPNEVYTVTAASEGIEIFGAGVLSDLIGYALNNGAVAVVAVAVSEESAEGYESAVSLLGQVEDLPLIICDSTQLEVQQKIRDSVVEASLGRKERIAIFGGESEMDVSELCAHATGLNCERAVMVCGKYTDENGGLYSAAAVAGMIAKETDPALPLNGVSVVGIACVSGQYTDNELDLLIGAGVMPLEESGGVISAVRGITTKTMTDGVSDNTWRELTSILTVDEVIADMRTALRLKFLRVKNTEQTRGAIRSQVVLELESKKSRELIVEYNNVNVSASEEDTSVCLVSFGFSVARGINQIWLTAQITV